MGVELLIIIIIWAFLSRHKMTEDDRYEEEDDGIQ